MMIDFLKRVYANNRKFPFQERESELKFVAWLPRPRRTTADSADPGLFSLPGRCTASGVLVAHAR